MKDISRTTSLEQFKTFVKVSIPEYVANILGEKDSYNWEQEESRDIKHVLETAYGNKETKHQKFIEWVRANPIDYFYAVEFGYNIIEDPKYVVILPKGIFFSMLVKTSEGSIDIMDSKDVLGTIHNNDILFTEEEIKSYDKNYWAFAKPEEEYTHD